MSGLAYVAFSLHGILFLALVAVCAFDDGQLAHDWWDCLIPLGLLLVPFGLAVLGAARRSTGLMASASVTGCLLGFVSLTGPGLFVLIPSILYGICAARLSSAPVA